MYTNCITIYIAEKNVEDNYGSIEINGYKNLKKFTEVISSTSYSESDIALYGSNINAVYKFIAKYYMDISIDGGDGIWLKKPITDENGICYNPDFINSPLTKVNNVTLFDAIKQQY